MAIQKHGFRPQRGKTISLTTDPDITAASLLNQAVKKMKDFNKDVKDGPFLLLYPDCTEIINIPGTQRPFTLETYKAEVGKPYQRITVFICLKKDFEEGTLWCLTDITLVLTTVNFEIVKCKHHWHQSLKSIAYLN